MKGKTQPSSNSLFIMAKGRAVGNIPPVKKARKGKIPLPASAQMADRDGRFKMGAMGQLKRGLK